MFICWHVQRNFDEPYSKHFFDKFCYMNDCILSMLWYLSFISGPQFLAFSRTSHGFRPLRIAGQSFCLHGRYPNVVELSNRGLWLFLNRVGASKWRGPAERLRWTQRRSLSCPLLGLSLCRTFMGNTHAAIVLRLTRSVLSSVVGKAR